VAPLGLKAIVESVWDAALKGRSSTVHELSGTVQDLSGELDELAFA
jgi:hypothetical protein